jgi:hypothetical protein
MSMSDRDRKILLGIVPLLVIVAYWFLLLSPKREEAATAAKEMTEQQDRRDAAKQLADSANSSKTDFAAEYGEIVRLGKAIPSRVDMPSLLVQLDRAAEGTGITFTKITAGERIAVAPATPPSSSSSSSSSATPTAAGGAPAQSAPGTATEAANTAAQTSEQRSSAAESSGVSAADTQTSTSSGGGLPVGGGTTGGSAGAAPAASGALETVPLDLEFQGNFFRLANFFHDIKRFVHVVNENVVVNGRLVTIEGVNFASDPLIFPRIKAELKATVYLSPLAQGETAGATPAGPATTTPASTTPAPSDGSTPAPAPTAAATP